MVFEKGGLLCIGIGGDVNHLLVSCHFSVFFGLDVIPPTKMVHPPLVNPVRLIRFVDLLIHHGWVIYCDISDIPLIHPPFFFNSIGYSFQNVLEES